MEKINLIYICGSGYSGSTLLDLLLGSHSKMESVGEIHRYSKHKGICTCLKNVAACHYWQEVKKRFQRYLSEIDRSLADVNTSNIAFGNLKLKLDFILRSKIHFSSDFIRNYGIDNYYLYKSILDVTGKEIIIDSSKQLKRFVCLQSSGKFNAKLIYLIRGCCGYLYSKKKRKYGKVVKTTIIDEMGNLEREIKNNFLDGCIKTSLTWYFRQTAFLNYLKKHNFENTIVVQYENLCLDPKKELLRICDFIGAPFEESMLNFGEVPHHNIAGNPMRINKKKTKAIIYDDAWKTRLTSRELFLCHSLNKKLNRKLNKEWHLMNF